MGCFVVAEFLLTSASHGPSAIAEPLVYLHYVKVHPNVDHIHHQPLVNCVIYVFYVCLCFYWVFSWFYPF